MRVLRSSDVVLGFPMLSSFIDRYTSRHVLILRLFSFHYNRDVLPNFSKNPFVSCYSSPLLSANPPSIQSPNHPFGTGKISIDAESQHRTSGEEPDE